MAFKETEFLRMAAEAARDNGEMVKVDAKLLIEILMHMEEQDQEIEFLIMEKRELSNENQALLEMTEYGANMSGYSADLSYKN